MVAAHLRTVLTPTRDSESLRPASDARDGFRLNQAVSDPEYLDAKYNATTMAINGTENAK